VIEWLWWAPGVQPGSAHHSLVAGVGFYKATIRPGSALFEMIDPAYFKDSLASVGMDIHSSLKLVQTQVFFHKGSFR